MPPELLFLMLEALGGSYTATAADLWRYDRSKHHMEFVQYADPFTLVVKMTNTEEVLRDESGF